MEGYIVVQVYTAEGAIPLRNAQVVISRTGTNGEEVMTVVKTDRSGRTGRLRVPAPPVANSLSPGNRNNFSRYNIRVEYPGYYSVVNNGVPVFEGQTSIQQVGMIPLTESEKRGAEISVDEREPFGNQ